MEWNGIMEWNGMEWNRMDIIIESNVLNEWIEWNGMNGMEWNGWNESNE